MKYLLATALLLFPFIDSFAQQNSAHQQAVRKFSESLSDEFPARKIFQIDTFSIEEKMRLDMEKDYSTYGMATATYSGTEEYEKLLSKYYKLLMAKLSAADKQVLLKAQRAWVAYKLAETQLVPVLQKPAYSGGGTIQTLIAAGRLQALVKQRVVELAEYYVDMQ